MQQTKRTGSNRAKETEEEERVRLEQQKKRSQTNRNRKRLEEEKHKTVGVEQEDDIQSSIRPPWPEPIPRVLKETRLQEFLHQMSMSVLVELTCAVCNIRVPAKDSKKIPLSKIPNIHLLKVDEELDHLLKSITKDIGITTSNNRITTVEPITSIISDCDTSTKQDKFDLISGSSTFNSSSFHYQNGIVLYKDGLFQENKMDMCTFCVKCHNALSKEQIPKFSAANNMWLGNIPVELQGLTIPEEKLISLYRHNSCIIKLHSPFHSTTTAQAALKGNCITFLQNVPNIVNSLPLSIDDLCDTLKVIFIGSRPPDRVHLKKVLTVRKNKIILALQWLKKFNVLYRNVDINLQNISQLPEDDVPECIMSTLEQKIGEDEIPSERAGYVPDPLLNPTEHTNADTIPISNR